MTYTAALRKKRKKLWKKRLTSEQTTWSAEIWADQIVNMEAELDERRHEAQRLLLLDDEAKELGFDDLEELIDWVSEQQARLERGESLDT